MSQPEDKLEAIERRKTFLTPREAFALSECNRKRQLDVAPSTRASFFEMFLNGRSCEDIRKANPGFTLGQIVRCRVEDGWDDEVAAHRADLMMDIRARTQQVQLEAVQFLGLRLAAFHRLHGDKVARYIQTGDEEFLKGIDMTSKAYKETLELLLKATGQEKKTVTVEGTIQHTGVTQQAGALSSEEADMILRYLEAQSEKK